MDECREGVVAIGLHEGHVALPVLVVADEVGDLLQDQQDTNGRKKALDDVGGEVLGQNARLGQAERKLHRTGDEDGEQEGLEGTQAIDLCQHDRCQAGGRAAHADVAATEGAHDDAADHTRDEAREERCARGQRDAQAERNGNQEHDETRHEVRNEGWAVRPGSKSGHGYYGNRFRD